MPLNAEQKDVLNSVVYGFYEPRGLDLQLDADVANYARQGRSLEEARMSANDGKIRRAARFVRSAIYDNDPHQEISGAMLENAAITMAIALRRFADRRAYEADSMIPLLETFKRRRLLAAVAEYRSQADILSSTSAQVKPGN